MDSKLTRIYWRVVVVVLLLVAALASISSFAAVLKPAVVNGLPTRARHLLPVLKEEAQARWPELARREYLAAQVEQETCVTLKDWRCWNPRAELKTKREYGFGLGQITITKRFDNFKEARKWDRALRDWKWEERFKPRYQLIALVAYDRRLWGLTRRLTDHAESALAFAFSAYNGGYGGLLKDRRLCAATKGCDVTRWFGHVEKTSFRARMASEGYKHSFFDINRRYVHNILKVRWKRYKGLL